MKVSIIGIGKVGSTLAYTLISKDLISELVLVSRNSNKAYGEALDLTHCQSFTDRKISIKSGNFNDTINSDVIIITASIPYEPHFKNRFDLAPGNIQILKELTPKLISQSPNAVYIIVSNPVDILTDFFLKISKLNHQKVLGVGTLIDSARFRSELSTFYNIHTDDLRAYILGEHGDSQFPFISTTSIGGESLKASKQIETIFNKTLNAGYDIVKNKGYTNYVISMATALILESIANDSNRVIPVSTKIPAIWKTENVCLSLPAVIGKSGIVKVLQPNLNLEEQELLKKSAQIIKHEIDKLS